MHMRITWGRLKADCWEDFERIYIEASRSREDVKGLRGHILARDVADPDAGYTISIWEDEDSMLAEESSSEQGRDRKETGALLQRPVHDDTLPCTRRYVGRRCGG